MQLAPTLLEVGGGDVRGEGVGQAADKAPREGPGKASPLKLWEATDSGAEASAAAGAGAVEGPEAAEPVGGPDTGREASGPPRARGALHVRQEVHLLLLWEVPQPRHIQATSVASSEGRFRPRSAPSVELCTPD